MRPCKRRFRKRANKNAPHGAGFWLCAVFSSGGMQMHKLRAALERLKTSPFRARFHLSEQDKAYIDQKGLQVIRSHAAEFVAKRLAPASPQKEWKQTVRSPACMCLLLPGMPGKVVPGPSGQSPDRTGAAGDCKPADGVDPGGVSGGTEGQRSKSFRILIWRVWHIAFLQMSEQWIQHFPPKLSEGVGVSEHPDKRRADCVIALNKESS